MKWRVAVAIVLAASVVGAVPPNIIVQENKLIGVWECYYQEDKAKAPSCFYSLEFRDDGTMFTKGISWVPGPTVERQHRYTATSKRINATDVSNNHQWHFDYKYLENGDLFVYKPPWDYRGWFTKNRARVPSDHGCHWNSGSPTKKN